MLVFVLAATFALHLPCMLAPRLLYDDFVIFSASWDLPTTVQNLWTPHNEHAMPLGRLAAWALLVVDARLDTLPARAALQGPLAAMLAAGLIYLFVRRELDQPFAAVLAALLYGVSLKYEETTTWYAASMWLLGFDTILLALLAAQQWRRRGHPGTLILAALASALAPGWYAGGILAGPLCVLYLLPQPVAGTAAWRGRALALVPLAGSLLFLLVSLPQNAKARAALEVFYPLFGLVCAGRATVDMLFLNPTGQGGRACPLVLVPVILVGLAAVVAWWNWRTPRRLLLVGLALIVGHYVLTFSPRYNWSYDNQMVSFTRYHMVPWFGMILLAVNGLAFRAWAADEMGGLSRRQAQVLGGVTIVLFAIQLPIAWLSWRLDAPAIAAQRDVLRRVAEVDRKCRAHGISAHDARAALDPIDMPLSGDALDKNAWNWLRGSARPQDRSPTEVQQLLAE